MIIYNLNCGFCQHYDGKEVGFCHRGVETKLEALSHPIYPFMSCDDGSIDHGLISHIVHGGDLHFIQGNIVPVYKGE